MFKLSVIFVNKISEESRNKSKYVSVNVTFVPEFMTSRRKRKEINTFFAGWFVGSRDSSFSRCTMHPWWHILQVRNWIVFCLRVRHVTMPEGPVSHATTPRRRYLFNLRVLLHAVFSSVAARFISATVISRIFNVGRTAGVSSGGIVVWTGPFAITNSTRRRGVCRDRLLHAELLPPH